MHFRATNILPKGGVRAEGFKVPLGGLGVFGNYYFIL